METKLTLRLDEQLISKAKTIAKSKEVSLSKMVADYFRTILSGLEKKSLKSPILSEITGILHSKTGNKKLREGYRKYLEEKYR